MHKFLFSFLILCALSNAQSKTTLTISGGFLPPESDLVGTIIHEISKRSNITIDYQVLPNKRSLIQANNGYVDGEGARILEINKYYPNLLPVPVQIHSINLIALTNRQLTLTKPSDLSNYNVGVIRGMKIAVLMSEKNTPVSLFKAPDHTTLINMLSANRLDVIITNKMGLFTSLDKIKKHKLFMAKEPLLSRSLYMQLHKKNKKYIPIFEKAIESMHKDGTYQKIHDDFYHPYHKKLKSSIQMLK